MKTVTLADLQESVQDTSAFGTLDDYVAISRAFLALVKKAHPILTRDLWKLASE